MMCQSTLWLYCFPEPFTTRKDCLWALLSNGDFRISYDWVTFTVKENKSVIDVEVQKNETGKDRSVFFATSNSYKQAYLPNMIVTQRAK